jgi:hypothetical protein
MSSESVCQVARSWVDVGSFHTRLVVRFVIFYSVSPEYHGYTLVHDAIVPSWHELKVLSL